MPLNSSGTISIGGPTAGQSINLALGLSATANSDLNSAAFRALAGIPSGTIALSNFYGASAKSAIFAYGAIPSPSGLPTTLSTSNKVTYAGVVATDTAGVGATRYFTTGVPYGSSGLGVFSGGYSSPFSTTSVRNYISSTGVVATDTSGTIARGAAAGAPYGGDKAIIGYGSSVTSGPGGGTQYLVSTELISNTGVYTAVTSGATAPTRNSTAATSYGGDKAIFAYGYSSTGTAISTSNLVSNTGVIAAAVTGVGTARSSLAAVNYGNSGQAMFAFGQAGTPVVNTINYVSNTGVVATDTAGTGTARTGLGAANLGVNGIFGFGVTGTPFTYVSITNKVGPTGVVASDTAGVGTGRTGPGCTNFGT